MIRFGSHRQPANVRTDWLVAADIVAAQDLAQPVQSPLTADVRHEHSVRSFWEDIADVLASSADPTQTEPRPITPIEAAVTGAMRSAALNLERPPVVWGGLGFITGILAWHVIGFWGFVSTVVFNQDGVVEQAALERPTRTVPAVAGYARVAYKADPKFCVSLVLDRATGQTQPAACLGDTEPLRDAGRQKRGNSLVANNLPVEPNSWSTATAVDAVPAESGTLEPKDFDLEIHSESLKR